MDYGKRTKRRLRTGIFLLMLFCAMNIFTFTSGAAKATKKIELNKTKVSTTVDRVVQLRLMNAKGTVTWKSSDRSVATVSKTGKVLALSKGSCKISAKYKGKTYRCTFKAYKATKTYLPSVLRRQYTVSKNQDKVILAGSSSIEFWKNASSALSPYKVMNMGVAGTTVSDWEKLYSSLIVRYNPKAIVLYVGSNDIGNGCDGLSGYQTAKATQKLIRKLQKKLPDTQIYYVSICPTLRRCNAWDDIKSCNRRMEAYCAGKKNLHFIDLETYYWQGDRLKPSLYADDKLHPSAKAYQIWGKVIKSALRKGKITKSK